MAVVSLVRKISFYSVLIILLGHQTLFGQKIEEIFKSFPLEYTPGLTTIGKDSLVRFGLYTLPNGDSLESEKYELYWDSTNCISLTNFYDPGPSGFLSIQLKSLTKNNGETIVVYSRHGGGLRAFDQHELKIFDYKDGKFSTNEFMDLPKTIPTLDFLIPNLPDSLHAETLTLSTGYNLSSDMLGAIEYYVFPQTDQFNKLIRQERIRFIWNGETFDRVESPID